jgi:hypothetical protein
MKLKINKNRTATVSGLTVTEMGVMLAIVDVANRRCFHRQNSSDGFWYSGDDFVLRLNDDEREALTKIGNEIREFYGY